MIENNIYRDTINKIVELSKEQLCSDISMVEKQLAKENIKHSEETTESILAFLEENKKEIIQFSVKKIELISDDELDEDDDYYPEDDEEDSEEEDNGFSQTFLIDYILELLLIKKGESYLEDYLKKLRIPNSKKYAKELRGIYNLIKKNS